MNHQSRLYKELRHGDLVRIMATVFADEPVLDYHLLSGGLFNTTYRVITKKHDVVLRMGPVHPELLLPYEHRLMTAEALTNRLCLENGVPASVVVHLDTSKTVIGRDFMVLERIDSIPLSDPSISPEKYNEALFECGTFVRRMHSVTGNQFGRLSNIVAGKGHSCWYDAVLAEFTDLFAQAAPHRVFDNDLQTRALAFVENCKAFLSTVTVPHLVHADLWAGNVLVRKDADHYQVCAIIDGDRALFGDADFDLATPWMITPEFLAGYGNRDPALTPADMEKKRNVYSLLLALMDTYIWKIQYNQADVSAENLAAAERILHS